jgi:hypothetical protein
LLAVHGSYRERILQQETKDPGAIMRTRYTTIEIALTNLKQAGIKIFKASDIAKRVGTTSYSVAKILYFTSGIERIESDRVYRFLDGERIKVDTGCLK